MLRIGEPVKLKSNPETTGFIVERCKLLDVKGIPTWLVRLAGGMTLAYGEDALEAEHHEAPAIHRAPTEEVQLVEPDLVEMSGTLYTSPPKATSPEPYGRRARELAAERARRPTPIASPLVSQPGAARGTSGS